ncbi:MAG: efflux RND transporter periplasmic adaptor subunit, partial [Bacteroidales bacterium]|nr:efflux RND transporter periplasmic adaptor subunit [Bacteroidales bacterium]
MKHTRFLPLLFAFAALACNHAPQSEQETVLTRVKTAGVNRQQVSFPVHASGLILPAHEVKLSFKTGGIIEALYADNGTRVTRGTLLATLNLAEIEAQVNQAESAYAKAERDYARAKNLFRDSVATLEQFQNAETGFSVAKSTLEAARFNLQHSRIYAPENGVILRRLAEEHEVIAPGSPVFIFGITGKNWKIKAGLADRDYVRVQTGDSAVVTLDAYPGKTFGAVVSQLGEAANPLTGTYETELLLDDKGERLAAGFVANVEIFPSLTADHYLVPVEALVDADGSKGFVFVLTDSSRVSKTEVEITGITGVWAAVNGSFVQPAEVVTSGAA